MDYGCLKNTTAMNGGGIDVRLGSQEPTLEAVICTVDLIKRDSEIKLLIGCTEEEKQIIFDTHKESKYRKGILIRRSPDLR